MTETGLDFGRPLAGSRALFSPAELELFSDLLREVEALYGGRLLSVKLVGSRARGTAMERSDYDFLVLLDAKRAGITDNFRRDAIALWPCP